MKYFLDTEFSESGHMQPIMLISIGIVSEDGREYYAEPNDTDLSFADEWLHKNVIPHLTGPKKNRKDIADDILEFIGWPFGAHDEKPEFWAYFADYDWVVFCQLFGRMIDLPAGLPMLCHDIKQMANHMGIPKHAFPKQVGVAHNALEDARWNRKVHMFLCSHVQRDGSNGLIG